MKVGFGLSLDGYAPLLPKHALAMPVYGPLGFLQFLETRLGLKSKSVSPAMRVIQFRTLLDEIASTGPVFFTESLKRDPFAVAEYLLKCRDDLVEAGWDGTASENDTVKIRAFAAIELQAKTRLSPSTADRLRAVLLELDYRSAGLDSIAVYEPQSHLPKIWQLICAKLGAHYQPGAFHTEADPSDEASDLVRIQNQLREMVPAQKLTLRGDRSLMCVTAFSEITLAQATAQLLKSFQTDSTPTVTLVSSENATPLDQALSSYDQATLGIQRTSKARSIPQVLLLALRLYWKPIDPRALLEFLAHPACPVMGVLRFNLAIAIAECPGIGGPRWNEAIAAAKESIETASALSAVEIKEAISRIDQDLKEWLLVAEFDPKTGASGLKLSECCGRVARWAALQSAAERSSATEAHQFRALASLSSEMAELLQAQPVIGRAQLERLLHQVSGAGWPGGVSIEALGCSHRVANPGAIHERVANVVWWNFGEPPPPCRLPWTTQEIGQLRAHGAEFPSQEELAAIEAEGWLRPILAASKQVILICPREYAGEPVAKHPLLTRLVALLDGKSNPLPVIDLDSLISGGESGSLWEFVQMKHRPLPVLRRWWKLNSPENLQPRDVESYSSAEKFIYDPSAWVFRYKAALKSGPVASLRLQDDFRQEGTLLHRMLDLLLNSQATSLNWQTCTRSEMNSWLDGTWPVLLEQEAANLLLPGRRAKALELLELGKQSIWELINQLRQAKVVEARSNVTLQAVSFVGGQIGGIIDLLVRNHLGQTGVVDLKLGGFETREKELQENRALQLSVYGHLLRNQHQGVWPASAFYLLRKQRLLSTVDSFFPGARVVTSKFPPGDIGQCWTDFEQVWQWRRKQLDEGWIELTSIEIDEGGTVAGAPDSTPPVPHWVYGKSPDVHSDFVALTGWRVDA